MEQAPSAPAAVLGRRRIAVLAALAAWAMAVPWVAKALGAGLDVPARLEVVDHVIPGLVVLGCCALLAGASELRRLALTGAACLAGFWITATHATLVPEALDGVTPWAPAVLHLSAGLPVTLLAMWMLLTDAGR